MSIRSEAMCLQVSCFTDPYDLLQPNSPGSLGNRSSVGPFRTSSAFLPCPTDCRDLQGAECQVIEAVDPSRSGTEGATALLDGLAKMRSARQ